MTNAEFLALMDHLWETKPSEPTVEVRGPMTAELHPVVINKGGESPKATLEKSKRAPRVKQSRPSAS